MRKFDGVNLKKKKVERRCEPPLILPAESDFVFAPPQKRRIKYSYINVGNEHFVSLKNIAKMVVWLIVITALVYIGKQAFKTQKSLLALQDSMEKNLEQVQVYAGNGNMEGSFDQLDELQENVIKSKLIAQTWGQDINYFQYLPGRKSALTQKEILLTTGYDVINLSSELQTDLSSLQENSIALLGTKSYSIDLALIGNRASKIIKKVNKRVASRRHLLKGVDSVQAEKISDNLNLLSQKTSDIETFIKRDLPWLSGENGKEKNILLIFQNNNELRGGSGGSLGSFGVAKFKDGSLEKIDFGTNIYKIDKEFVEKETVIPPDELVPFNNGRWSMKQSGFAVDGKEALDKIMWFYNRETGNGIDGVITIDTTAFISLLEIVGPIEMAEYGKTLDASNFMKETQNEVQVDYFSRSGGTTENEPKKILGDMIPIFTEKLFSGLGNKERSIKIFSALAKSLENKNILFDINNAEFQSRLNDLNYTGTVKNTNGDYLYTNASNLGGAKTNQLMLSDLNLSVNIGDDGKINNKLRLERNHTGDGVFPDGRAQDFMRILIPKNSQIKSFSPIQGNFQIWYHLGYYEDNKYYIKEEAARSVVCFWISLFPGQKGVAEVEYLPDYSLDTSGNFIYSILIQHQPGAPTDHLNLDIAYPAGFAPTNVRNFDAEKRKINLKMDLNKDKEVKIKFQKIN